MGTQNAGRMSRRLFMVGAGGLTFGIAMARETLALAAPNAKTAQMSPWMTLHANGTITILSASSEMGQGSRSHVPLVLAEEMDADWEKVEIADVPPIDAVYGNPNNAGNMIITAGARAMNGYYPLMRRFGAQARLVLLENVARHWNVPANELTTEPSMVVHRKSGRRISYGDIVAFLELPKKAPEISDAMLKKPENFRYLGKRNVQRLDVPSKVTGGMAYGIDAKVPGMVYGAVLRAPVEGSGPASIDDTASRALKGVIDIVRLPYGVGVVADRTWTAFRARDLLKVTWTTEGKAWGYDSDRAREAYSTLARDLSVPGSDGSEKIGDAKAAMKNAANVVDAEYFTDHAYHAQMEPLNATAHVSNDGKRAEIWVGTQSQTVAVDSARTTLGVSPADITPHYFHLGGGFGRRGHREHEYLTDALLLSKAVKRPVKVTWTREDDMRNGRFRPSTAQYLRAGLDEKGKIAAWHHRVAGDACLGFIDPVRFAYAKSFDRIVGGGTERIPYDIPNTLAEVLVETNGVRTSPWRGVGYGPNKFAATGFLDEIAAKRGMDPVAFHLELSKGDARAEKTIRSLAEFCGWGRKAEGRAMGFTFYEYHHAYVAAAAEISVDTARPSLNVHRLWAVLHAGFAVQPENVRAQMEGGIVYALGSVLSERITLRNGEVQETNFDKYLVPRMADLPEIHVRVLSDPSMPPYGIGEHTVPGVAPAIANAFAAATGKRIRHIPMTPDRLRDALGVRTAGRG